MKFLFVINPSWSLENYKQASRVAELLSNPFIVVMSSYVSIYRQPRDIKGLRGSGPLPELPTGLKPSIHPNKATGFMVK